MDHMECLGLNASVRHNRRRRVIQRSLAPCLAVPQAGVDQHLKAQEIAKTSGLPMTDPSNIRVGRNQHLGQLTSAHQH